SQDDATRVNELVAEIERAGGSSGLEQLVPDVLARKAREIVLAGARTQILALLDAGLSPADVVRERSDALRRTRTDLTKSTASNQAMRERQTIAADREYESFEFNASLEVEAASGWESLGLGQMWRTVYVRSQQSGPHKPTARVRLAVIFESSWSDIVTSCEATDAQGRQVGRRPPRPAP
ncbi:MAG TPA: hypothetical protein VJ608_03935, partial [Albitalea sp.]|nr:hypothetical protein [Albitalea sp.]